MSIGHDRSILSGLGPFFAQADSTGTPPLTASGVVNATVGLTPVKVLSARATASSIGAIIRRCNLRNLHATNILAYKWVAAGSAAAPTATGGGTSTDGVLVLAGLNEYFSLWECFDLYVVASAITTPYQLTVNEA